MPIGSVSFNYALNHFDIKKTFDTRINIKDELEFLRFSSSYESQGLGLSYISSPGIDPEKNILIVDTANNIIRNAKQNIEETKYLLDNFIIDFAGFHIADVMKVIDDVETPLYYWHDMSTVDSFNNLEILDGNKNPINPKYWSFYDESATLNFTRKGIYSNLICNIDPKKNTYEIFYVRYKDLTTNMVVEKLLDSQPYYAQASFNSTRTQREYILTQIGQQYNLSIVFDSLNYSPTGLAGSQRFWIKRKQQSKIALEKPGVVSAGERWNIRITPGNFFHNGMKYWVPEYYTQLFSPAFPYRLIKEKEAKLINGNLLYLDVNPIADLGIDGFFIYITVKEQNGAIVRAITNDPNADTYITKQGFVTDVFYEKDVIQSISANSGFILLNETIEDNLQVFVTCRYIERYYSYDYLSVNPSINPEILGKKVIFYILPNASDRSVHHLILDKNNSILESSYPTTETTYDSWKAFADVQGYFRIGEVYVVQSLSIPDISLLDTRILGGGVAEKYLQSALQLQNEVSWYWDLGNWDGTAYPGMGAIVVYLPRYILKELGGNFNREQVLEIVKRHAASGSYIIVKYYDESTEIKNLIPGNGQVFVEWYIVDANYYNVYIGNSPDNLSLQSTQPGTRSSLTITGLENNKNYYIQIGAVVGGIERLRSRVLGFMPFNFSSTLPTMKYGEGKFIEGSYE